MNPSELWQWVHYSYGDELGLTSSDDDYVPPDPDLDLRNTDFDLLAPTPDSSSMHSTKVRDRGTIFVDVVVYQFMHVHCMCIILLYPYVSVGRVRVDA